MGISPYKAHQQGFISLALIILLAIALSGVSYLLYNAQNTQKLTAQQLETTHKQLRATQSQLAEKEDALSTQESRLYKLRSQSRSLKKQISSIEANLQQQSTHKQKALNELQEKLKHLDKQNSQLQSEKKRMVKQFHDGTTIIRLEDTILFSIGSATLNENGRKTLSIIAETLRTFPNHLISVEGHTDQKPIISAISEKYPSNWELSTARAAYAIRFLIQQGLPETQFQAIGYGSTRPIAKSDTPKGQEKNRRIEILVYPPEKTIAAQEITTEQ